MLVCLSLFLTRLLVCPYTRQALRLFVESVLRYGLPPNYSYFAVSYKPDEEKRLRIELQRLYGYLDKAGSGEGEVRSQGAHRCYRCLWQWLGARGRVRLIPSLLALH